MDKSDKKVILTAVWLTGHKQEFIIEPSKVEDSWEWSLERQETGIFFRDEKRGEVTINYNNLAYYSTKVCDSV
jgi:hypothetical protein